MKAPVKSTSFIVAILLVTGCATNGIGTGSTRNNDLQATFMWASKSDRTGTLEASLSNGETYIGEYFQITAETRVDELGPLWGGWRSGWRGSGGWRDWDAAPTPTFVTHYSGRVVANLAGPNGRHMRCRFRLIRPSSGMSGGGQGQCQTPDNKTIDASFPHK
jgi:hypothetical protein